MKVELTEEAYELHQKYLRGEKDGIKFSVSPGAVLIIVAALASRVLNLRSANLSYADLRSANLSSANLSYANLSYANLSYANLSYADLRSANLSSANLSYANLSYANLSYADLRSANLPSPPMVLMASWGNVSDKLCLELMRYDAANHPDPKKFDEWADENGSGQCPYSHVRWQIAVLFQEKRSLWKPGKAKSALYLVEKLFKEKEIKR